MEESVSGRKENWSLTKVAVLTDTFIEVFMRLENVHISFKKNAFSTLAIFAFIISTFPEVR